MCRCGWYIYVCVDAVQHVPACASRTCHAAGLSHVVEHLSRPLAVLFVQQALLVAVVAPVC